MPIPDAVHTLADDLRQIFHDRLRSVVAYALRRQDSRTPLRTLVIVDSLVTDDLTRCAALVVRWEHLGLATPLVLKSGEFDRSLDAFPFEFGSILADHVIVAGQNPFDGLSVAQEDLRRACEVQARSHLLHLREDYLETAGSRDVLPALVLRSAPALAALLEHVRSLQSSYRAAPILAEISHLTAKSHFTTNDAVRIMPEYLTAMERLTNDIDSWSVTGVGVA
ncbi:MAG: hypothetical protein LBQ09_02930 [Acidobacteriaceae bacterium]|jgi:hypothetical protein|nr:hypothetical protein [Acidobacteriaceae bacterium]